MADPDIRRVRARQVGMLMQAYRRSHGGNSSRRVLSQEGLLELMGGVDPRYLDQYDRSTVSRWESGEILPRVERIRVFGEALSLSQMEIDGLISLAGLGPDGVSKQTGEGEIHPVLNADIGDPPEVRSRIPITAESASIGGQVESQPYGRHLLRYCLSSFVLPGFCVAVAGYALASVNWNSSLAMAAYVIIAICLVSAREFHRLRRSNNLRDILFVSVFILHSVPLVQSPLTRLDPYGFYAIGEFAGTTIPITLCLITNLLISLMAGVTFDWLRRRNASSGLRGGDLYRRALMTAVPPVGLVYVYVLVFSDVGGWVSGLGTLMVLAGVMTALVILRDGQFRLGEWDQKLLLLTALMTTIVLAALGVAGTLVTYLEPSLTAVPDRNLLHSWTIDFDALGYSESELRDRFRISIVWSSLITIVYMVVVLGGNLIMTISRLDSGASVSPSTAAVAMEGGAPARKRPSRLTRLDLRYWWKRAMSHRLLQA